MITMQMPLYQYNDMRELVEMTNVLYFTEMGRVMVEADADEETFDRISEERGWR